MAEFLQFTIDGVTLGAIYGLLALGWVVIFRVSGVLNLAQGSFMVIGSLTVASLANQERWPLVLAILTALFATVMVGVTLDVAILRPARSGGHASSVIITLGVAEILGEASRHLWGADPLQLSGFLSNRAIHVPGGATVTAQQLLVWGTTAVLVGLLWLLFEKTLLGKALAACAQNPDGARIVGIDPKWMRTVAFVLASALAGVAGVLIAPTTPIGWDSGLAFGIVGFIAAVLGGWSYPGAIVGGLLVGLTENYVAGYISSAWKDVATYGVLLLVLLLRPEGLRGLSRTRPQQKAESGTATAIVLPQMGQPQIDGPAEEMPIATREA